MRDDPNTPGSKRTDGGGALSLLVHFLDRNMRQFHPIVRDFIGITVVLLVALYVVNGLFLPTYIRGQMFVNGAPAQGIQVSHAEATPMTSNELGWWMLPVPHGGFPSRIHLDFRNQNQKGCYIGSADIRGPWPVWSAFFPMDFVFCVDSDKCPSEIKVAQIAALGHSRELTIVFAQQQNAPKSSGAARVMLVINGVRVYSLPGLFRSSGRVYFKFFLNGQPVPDAQLGDPSSPFPLESQKEAWLPISVREEQRFKGFQTDISPLVSQDPNVPGRMIPKGKLTLKVMDDTSTSLGTLNLEPLFQGTSQIRSAYLKSEDPAFVDVDVSFRIEANRQIEIGLAEAGGRQGRTAVENMGVANAGQVSAVYVYKQTGDLKKITVSLGIGTLGSAVPVPAVRLSDGRYVKFSVPPGPVIACAPSSDHCLQVTASPSEPIYLSAAWSWGKSRYVLTPVNAEKARKAINARKFVDDKMVLNPTYVQAF